MGSWGDLSRRGKTPRIIVGRIAALDSMGAAVLVEAIGIDASALKESGPKIVMVALPAATPLGTVRLI